jgi:predicted small metal-binding protein
MAEDRSYDLEFECWQECGFLVRGKDEQEVIKIVRNHMIDMHNMDDVTERYIKDKLRARVFLPFFGKKM